MGLFGTDLSYFNKICGKCPIPSSDDKKETIEILEHLIRQVSVRKVEKSYSEVKPDYTDLNWMIDRLYWEKKFIEEGM